METIYELRAICQKPKIAMREKVGVTYNDFMSRFYLKISIYFTWLCLRLGMSANGVTLLSGAFAVIGGFFLALKSVWMVLLGAVFLFLYYVLDFSDGEVARYNKESSITGSFLDWYMLFVRDAAMFVGLALGALIYDYNTVMLLCAFLALLTPIMLKTIISSGWTVISWTRFGVIKTGNEVPEADGDSVSRKNEDLGLEITNGLHESGERGDIGKKLLKTLKFLLTIIFSHKYSPFALMVLVILQIIINRTILASFDFRPVLIIYGGTFGPMFVAYKVYRAVKTDAFALGYNRLFINPEQGKPRGDFFF